MTVQGATALFASAPSVESLTYSSLLAESHLAAAQELGKAERTRNALKLATARLLNRDGYRAMRVQDIPSDAGLAHGSFYTYYENKTQITLEVLEDFLRMPEHFRDAKVPRFANAYESIFYSNLVWTRMVRANAGLMRCLLQLSDEVPEFARLYEESSLRHAERTAKSILRHSHQPPPGEALVLAVVYALGGMIDDYCRKVIVQQDERLVGIVRRVAPSEESLVELLSTLWYRALYASEPPGPQTGSLLALDLHRLAGRSEL